MPTQMPGGSKTGGLGEKVENTLQRFLTKVYDATIGNLSDRIKAGINAYAEGVETQVVSWTRPAADALLAIPDLPTWARNMLTKAGYPTGQAGLLGAITVGGIMAAMVLPGLLAPVIRRWQQTTTRWARPSLPDISTAAAMTQRGYMPQAYFEDNAANLGYREEFIPALLAFAEKRIDAADFVRHAYLAGLGEGVISGYLADLGYKGAELTALLNIYQLRPGPSDLVRMGVREAWRDDVAARWGYDNDFPGQFGAEMQRAGDTEGWAQKYWRAHWELPSINMVLEMLHRGVVTDAEFDEYLRIADYPSGWRARISQVAYTPYTRVDTRRMYRFGVLDEVGVYNTYRDIGYDDQHAAAMTQFTVLDALEEERELTKSDVLKSYRLARFTQAEAQENLVALGYNATVAAMLLGNEDQAEEESKISGVVSNTHSLYIRGGISRSEVIQRLATYNLASAEVDRYFELWDLEKESRVALPTRSALDGFLGDDIITVAEYETGLAALSYTTESVTWFTQAVLLDKQAKAEKERERATDEAEKVAKREIATDYQRAKAALTVDLREVEARISELQTAIQARTLQYQTDTDLARRRVTVEELTRLSEVDLDVIREQRDTYAIETRKYREDIEALQTEIAGLRLDLEKSIDAALQEEARLQIATLQGHQEDIQAIAAEGRAEIASLEAEIVGLVDPTISKELQLRIAGLQTEMEVIQDAISGYREAQAQSKRALLDAGVDQVQGLKALYLDLAVQIAGEMVAIDEIQTLIAALRELGIDPELAGELHQRQELMAEVRANNAQAAVFLQEIDQAIVTIRLEQIDPAQAGKVQGLRVQIADAQLGIDQVQDAIAGLSTASTEAQAAISRIREAYKRDLQDLQRVQSVAAVEASYRADVADLQAELGQARNNKNGLRVQLAQIQFEYTD